MRGELDSLGLVRPYRITGNAPPAGPYLDRWEALEKLDSDAGNVVVMNRVTT